MHVGMSVMWPAGTECQTEPSAEACYNSASLALALTLSQRARGLISEHIRPRRYL